MDSHESQPSEELELKPQPTVRARRRLLPIILFLATCASTFWVGATRWMPMSYVSVGLGIPAVASDLETTWMPARGVVGRNWEQGLIYMACVLAILLTHEMGHFLATVRYRIAASFPIFLPIPFTPIGTLGAVIGMDGSAADRKQTFDIGIAGPLAGLVVALPILIIGIARLDFTEPAYGIVLEAPLVIQWLMKWIQPNGYASNSNVALSQLNAFYMAGWIGMVITGLNMLPVSQLDGGHVTYTLLGKKAHWIARGFMVLGIAYLVWLGAFAIWSIMIILVLFLGVDHPPTRDDSKPLGTFRTVLGYASLAIPFLCFPPRPFILG